MAAWREARWKALLDGSGCPICAAGRPPDILAEFTTTWVTGGSGPVPLPGYVAVVAKRHVVEPFDLPPPERMAFWEDVLRAARVLADLYRPVKMNYEIHGNTIPHLHAHLYPRLRDDPYVGGPIDAGEMHYTRGVEEVERLRRAFETET